VARSSTMRKPILYRFILFAPRNNLDHLDLEGRELRPDSTL
jgi:hypothetical protein